MEITHIDSPYGLRGRSAAAAIMEKVRRSKISNCAPNRQQNGNG
ncbi:hypothetical protein HMPREF9371_2436 [Neisseria shayeganii 871]|uniref:Uncharacterized protein n=1 Tax=Neisseria shayeganii 871 TaxID=1032488 RepID=G4CLE5_9NEIS|nr:hypothetical protein HMPREF9371_2436 [Neisseria shayeganii 871]